MNHSSKVGKHFLEIDILRGIAIVLMVIFHTGYNLNFFDLMDINITGGYWHLMARIVQYIFVITTGLTLYISYQKHLSEGKVDTIKKRLYHAGKLFFWALIITLVTWFLYDEQAVKFGILHFYSLAILLGLLFVNTRIISLVLGLGIILTAPIVINLTTNVSFLFPIGVTQVSFQSLDYFPLFPWLGWFLLGISLGGFAYPFGQPRINIALRNVGNRYVKSLRYVVRHSLFIYLVHQPLIALFIFFYKQIS